MCNGVSAFSSNMPTYEGQSQGDRLSPAGNLGNFGEYPPRRSRLCRNKSISSSVLPTISIMVDQSSVASSMDARDGRGGRRESMSSHVLNHAFTCNSIAESHQSYHSHPNLNSDLLEGTMYTRPVKKKFNENFLHDGYVASRAVTPSNANHIRSSFLALFTKRR